MTPQAAWRLQQMIKASGWPLAPEAFAPGANYSAKLEGGLVPFHWACQHGKDSLVKHMIEHGANVQDRTERGVSMLALALESKSFQTVMPLIDQLKAEAAPLPSDELKQRLLKTFSVGHVNLRNRIKQTIRDWESIQKK